MEIIEESTIERITDPEEVKKYFRVGERHKAKEKAIIDLIASTGMLLKGHFCLESGLHTQFFSRYADGASLNSNVRLVMDELISDLAGDNIRFDVIIVQPSAGHILGEMIATTMHKRLVIAEVDSHNVPTGELINDKYIYPNDRILIVSDVFTTGTGLSAILSAIRRCKAKPVAVALFADRAWEKLKEFEKHESIKVYSLGSLDFQDKTVRPTECSLDRTSKPIPSWEV
ncbi:MAG: phosphoribosyltransferase family protein [Dehalococcoidia bacterium]|jgi:orotate phosphoribosyltransferase